MIGQIYTTVKLLVQLWPHSQASFHTRKSLGMRLIHNHVHTCYMHIHSLYMGQTHELPNLQRWVKMLEDQLWCKILLSPILKVRFQAYIYNVHAQCS